MARLTRYEQQERTRATVLAAARDEFAEHGWAAATVDRIAARAELTRGAVYSNFPSKRALYLAVLLGELEPAAAPAGPPPELGAAAGAFTRAWLDRLPLLGDPPARAGLRLRSLTGVFEHASPVVAQSHRLEALLLGLALEGCAPTAPGIRRIRLAELILTLLRGAAHEAPGAADPFDLDQACRHLTGLDLADTWDPPHLPYAAPARVVDEPAPPDLDDGVAAVLGAARLAAAEEAVRAARPGERVTVVVVAGSPAEAGALVRLRVADLTGCLHRAGRRAPAPHLVVDASGATAAALGLPEADDTAAAVRIAAGRIVARADGHGAAHSVAALR